MTTSVSVVAALIAGGEARRFQGTFKPLLEINNKTLLARLIDALQTQVNEIVVNVNERLTLINKLGITCINDSEAGLELQYAGPLLGVASCLSWLKSTRPQSPWLITVPGDTLQLPENFVEKLFLERSTQQLSYATCNGQHHYLAALWHTDVLDDLLNFITSGNRAVKQFQQQLGARPVAFDNEGISTKPYFFNINTPKDYEFAKEHYT
ncbi:molybdopterin-guanine dinucleotide biosynthesis protein A [Alteromonadaceae bacterium 2753L.S.0a.02]|nr:molybdopterin-guanine dinucleotide biosynthesis protein A [Alteromonadaceae bacterium 2753L.S.0a.02]